MTLSGRLIVYWLEFSEVLLGPAEHSSRLRHKLGPRETEKNAKKRMIDSLQPIPSNKAPHVVFQVPDLRTTSTLKQGSTDNYTKLWGTSSSRSLDSARWFRPTVCQLHPSVPIRSFTSFCRGSDTPGNMHALSRNQWNDTGCGSPQADPRWQKRLMINPPPPLLKPNLPWGLP